MSYIVFYDVDKTLLSVNSGDHLFKRSFKEGFLSKRRLISVYAYILIHKLGLLDASKIIQSFPGWLKGIDVSAYRTMCKDILNTELIPLVRPEMHDELRNHKEKNATCVILSATIKELCVPLAELLEIDHVLCSELEQEKEKYTGRTVGKLCFREEKLARLHAYLEKHGGKIEDCYYYGDSIYDLPVLEVVGNPVCVKPDKELRRIAGERNWKII